jgi:hypothetical protein
MLMSWAVYSVEVVAVEVVVPSLLGPAAVNPKPGVVVSSDPAGPILQCQHWG